MITMETPHAHSYFHYRHDSHLKITHLINHIHLKPSPTSITNKVFWERKRRKKRWSSVTSRQAKETFRPMAPYLYVQPNDHVIMLPTHCWPLFPKPAINIHTFIGDTLLTPRPLTHSPYCIVSIKKLGADDVATYKSAKIFSPFARAASISPTM